VRLRSRYSAASLCGPTKSRKLDLGPQRSMWAGKQIPKGENPSESERDATQDRVEQKKTPWRPHLSKQWCAFLNGQGFINYAPTDQSDRRRSPRIPANGTRSTHREVSHGLRCEVHAEVTGVDRFRVLSFYPRSKYETTIRTGSRPNPLLSEAEKAPRADTPSIGILRPVRVSWRVTACW